MARLAASTVEEPAASASAPAGSPTTGCRRTRFPSTVETRCASWRSSRSWLVSTRNRSSARASTCPGDRPSRSSTTPSSTASSPTPTRPESTSQSPPERSTVRSEAETRLMSSRCPRQSTQDRELGQCGDGMGPRQPPPTAPHQHLIEGGAGRERGGQHVLLGIQVPRGLHRPPVRRAEHRDRPLTGHQLGAARAEGTHDGAELQPVPLSSGNEHHRRVG